MNRSDIIKILKISPFIFVFVFIYLNSIYKVTDFHLYWGSASAFFNGKNPYNPENMPNFTQIKNYYTGEVPHVWNPPIFFILVSYLFLWSFKYSFVIGQICTFFSLIGIILLMKKIKKISWYNFSIILLIFIMSSTTYATVVLNQITVQLSFFLILSLYYLKKRKDFFGGIFLPFLLIKPHIFLFYLSSVFILTLVQKRFYIFLGAITSLFLSLLIAFFINPSSFVDFINNVTGTTEYEVVGLFQFLPYRLCKYRYEISITLNLLFMLALLRIRKINFYYTLCLGLLFMPYGFLFDYSALLPVICLVFNDILLFGDRFKYKTLIGIVIFMASNLYMLFNPTSWTAMFIPLSLLWLMYSRKIIQLEEF